MDSRRDDRRTSTRRRMRELAAIGAALLVVPLAAIAGLKIPIDAGALAPIFTLPHSALGHVRSAASGVVQLARPGEARGPDDPLATAHGERGLRTAPMRPPGRTAGWDSVRGGVPRPRGAGAGTRGPARRCSRPSLGLVRVPGCAAASARQVPGRRPGPGRPERGWPSGSGCADRAGRRDGRPDARPHPAGEGQRSRRHRRTGRPRRRRHPSAAPYRRRARLAPVPAGRSRGRRTRRRVTGDGRGPPGRGRWRLRPGLADAGSCRATRRG